MILTSEALGRLADRTAELLILYISESGFAKGIIDTHNDSIRSVELPARSIPANLEGRVGLEVLCLATVLVMTQEIPKVLRGASAELGADAPGVEAIQSFNGELVRKLHQKVDQRYQTAFARRLSDYSKAESAVGAADLFAMFVPQAAGEGSYAAMKIVAWRFIEPIIDMSQMVVRRAFSEPPPREHAEGGR